MNPPHSRYHHGDLRAAVLRRAEITLQESGVGGLSLRQLARDLGVSHAAPSRHFRDKQALLDALALTGFERLAAAFENADMSGEFADQMHAVAGVYLRFAIDSPALLALMFARKHSPTSGAEMADAVGRAFAVPVSLIASAQASGEVVEGDPMRIGMSSVASLQGLASFVSSGFISEETASELVTETIAHLLNGLRPRV